MGHLSKAARQLSEKDITALKELMNKSLEGEGNGYTLPKMVKSNGRSLKMRIAFGRAVMLAKEKHPKMTYEDLGEIINVRWTALKNYAYLARQVATDANKKVDEHVPFVPTDGRGVLVIPARNHNPITDPPKFRLAGYRPTKQ